MNGTILFVCQGNACRSPMAEGFGREILPEDVSVSSAGMRPIGIDDRAIQVMDELGIDLREQESSDVNDITSVPEQVVAMSTSVAQKLPERFRNTTFRTWSITDPYHADGSREQQLEVFRSVRDDIRTHVEHLTVGS